MRVCVRQREKACVSLGLTGDDRVCHLSVSSPLTAHASVHKCVCVTRLRRVCVSEEKRTQRQIQTDAEGARRKIRKTHEVKSSCQSVSTLSARPLTPLCCLHSSSPSFLHLILT